MSDLLHLICLFFGIDVTIVIRKVTGRERRKLLKKNHRNR